MHSDYYFIKKLLFMKKVGIIGGSGFIGSYVSKAFLNQIF